MKVKEHNNKKVAFISSYLPRKCGIATFTSDLIRNAALAGGGRFKSSVIAMQSGVELDYGPMVQLKIRKNAKYDYVLAADYINGSDVDMVSVQHEFGLFGGEGGAYLNFLLRRVNKPIITTLHTILEKPCVDCFKSLTEVCRVSDKVVTMNEAGVSMLRGIYGVPAGKIELIPHGIPDLPFNSSGYYKQKLGLAGRKIILTFGLLSRNKGVEVMLRALPEIVKADPSVLYIVLGQTHPEVIRYEGQSYQHSLTKMVKDMSLQQNVVFHNRFVEDEELFQFLEAADIYITPYLNKEQLTSGTLAFAVGAGKAVISTPYWAAQGLLAEGRGKLVRFGDSGHIAKSVIEILGNRPLFNDMKKRAYEYGRNMVWPKVGQAYWKLFCSRELSLRHASDSVAKSPVRVESSGKLHGVYQSA